MYCIYGGIFVKINNNFEWKRACVCGWVRVWKCMECCSGDDGLKWDLMWISNVKWIDPFGDSPKQSKTTHPHTHTFIFGAWMCACTYLYKNTIKESYKNKQSWRNECVTVIKTKRLCRSFYRIDLTMMLK